ncbi:SNAP receptor [Geranomyces michiganensis]|nr:SNAP receptor [Geranomyces michiganensis]
MSFGDLEKGVPGRTYSVPVWGPAGAASSSSSSSAAVGSSNTAVGAPFSPSQNTFERASHTIFTISANVATIQKLLAQFGTAKDTSDMRHRLHTMTEDTRDLVRQTGGDLKQILAQGKSSTTPSGSPSLSPSRRGRGEEVDGYVERQKKMATQKLQKDFEEVLKRFQGVSKLAVEKSREYVTMAKAAHAGELAQAESDDESAPLIANEQRQQLAVLDNEIDFNEALINEREQDLKGIEQSISEVNEIFRDLGTMVHEQQYMLDNIESNVQTVEINMENATGELRSADRYQRSTRNKLCCILVLGAIVVLVVVIIVIT